MSTTSISNRAGSSSLSLSQSCVCPHSARHAARPVSLKHRCWTRRCTSKSNRMGPAQAGRDAQRRFFAVDSSLASLGRWDDEQSVMQERSPRLGLCRSSYLHPSTHCYDALVLLNFQPSAQPAREVSVRELERQVPARLAKEELSKRKVSAQQARQSQKSCLLTMKACEDARLLGALVHSRIAAAMTAMTHRTMPTLVK